MKDKILNALQTFSRGVIQPVFFMAIMGIVIALCAILSFNFMPGSVITAAKTVSGALRYLIGNMSLAFAVGMAVYFAKKGKNEVAILAVLGYMMYLNLNNAMLKLTDKLVVAKNLFGTGQKMELGIQVVDMGVFLGIILGCIIGYVHNKCSSKEFKGIMQPWGGARYTFIVLIPIMVVFSLFSVYVWPIFAGGIAFVTKFLATAGGLGVFLYDFLLRILIPTGLHHFVWSPILMTSVGGVMELGGQVFEGARPIVWAELANLSLVKQMDPSIRFLHTNISVLFGFAGITLAFIKTAKPEYKQKVKNFIIPACLTCVMSGLGEPILFLFIFTAPILAVADAVLTATFSTLAYLIGMRMHISSLIPTIADNLLLGAGLTKWPLILIVGPLATLTWYLVFKTLILKLNLKTPGRSEFFNDMMSEEKADKKQIKEAVKSQLSDEEEEVIATIIEGLGGADNIEAVNNCYTRLRVDVKDVKLVKENIINTTGNNGMVVNGKNVQIIYGIKARAHKIKVCEALGLES